MAYEDFTTFTEVDGGDDIAVIATKTEWVDMPRNVDSYVYKDYDIGTFGDFVHEFELKYVTAAENSSLAAYALSNLIDELQAHIDASAQAIMVMFHHGGGAAKMIMLRDNNSANADTFNAVFGTLYYVSLERDGTDAALEIYSDSERTVLVDTLTIVCTNTTFRYLYSTMSRNSSQAFPGSGFIQNLFLAPAEPETHTPSDTVNISDSIVFKHEIYPSDSINVTDSILYTHLISIVDSISVSDSILFKRLLILADSVNVSDSIFFKRLLILADSVNVSDSIVYKHLVALADSIGITDSALIKYIIHLSETIGVTDSILYKHLLNLFDTVNITDSFAVKHSIFILDNISIIDSIDITSSDNCGTIFQLRGDSYAVFLPIPEYGQESGAINNELTLFDFWVSDRSIINIGIKNEPFTLTGTIFACTDNEETEMTLIATKFFNIHEMMDNNEKIRITGLNECLDAIYVIKNFNYGTIGGSPYAYTWSLTLEYVRAI